MQKTATVYDDAAHAGVSIVKVSRVFRRPADVRAPTRENVLASVRALGYVPSAIARGLAARRTGVLGLYFPDFDAVEDADDDPTVTTTPLSKRPMVGLRRSTWWSTSPIRVRSAGRITILTKF